MATKTIGTGGDYSTIQAWEDSLAATLTAPEVGQLKNESFSGDVTFSGTTTSATNTITLECEANASFRDHANKATNALYPTASYGAIITNSTTYSICITISVDYITIRNIQILKTGSPSRAISTSGIRNYVTYDSVLAQGKPASTSPVMLIAGANSVVKNCVVINANTSGYGLEVDNGSTPVSANTIVRPTVNSAASTGIKGTYATPICKNNAIFGFTTAYSGVNASSDYNASDVALGTGSNNQASKTYANQFQNTGGTLSASDFRLKTGADCIDTGTSSGMPSTDIVGQTRSGTYDIGAWEVQAASSATYYVIGSGCGGASSVIGE